MLRWPFALLLLSALSATAQSPSGGAAVPVQSLAQAMTEATQGTTAFVHTHYGTTTGLLLLSGDRVMTARHGVLTPSGDIATEITVGIPQLPLNNVVQVHATPIAQDQMRDLVLLSLPADEVVPVVSGAHGARTRRSKVHEAGTPCESSLTSASAVPAPQIPPATGPSKTRSHHSHAPQDEVQVTTFTPPAPLQGQPATAANHVPIAARQKTTNGGGVEPQPPQPAVKAPAAPSSGIKIVEDGPKTN